MFGRKSRRAVFERDVRIEIELLTKLHGENAAQVAAEKAVRPTNRTRRRLVLEEAHRRLSGQATPARKGILTMIFG
jgi:hypothetical protein